MTEPKAFSPRETNDRTIPLSAHLKHLCCGLSQPLHQTTVHTTQTTQQPSSQVSPLSSSCALRSFSALCTHTGQASGNGTGSTGARDCGATGGAQAVGKGGLFGVCGYSIQAEAGSESGCVPAADKCRRSTVSVPADLRAMRATWRTALFLSVHHPGMTRHTVHAYCTLLLLSTWTSWHSWATVATRINSSHTC